MRPFRIGLLSVLAASTLLLAACGGDDDGTADASATTRPPVPSARFPVSVQADQGEVTIAARPQRIVSLSPSLTEMLYAIGAGDQVVAVDQHSDYPAGTPVTDLSGFRPNIEAIGGHEPDLVVLANDRDGAVSALTNLGIPTLLLSSPDHLDGVYHQINVLGAATGHPAEADDVAGKLRADIDHIAASVQDRDEPLRYYYELSASYHSVTSDTFIGELLRLAGLASVADGVDPAAGGFPQLSSEYILDADPDVIFLAYAGGETPTPDAVAASPGWERLQAVREDRIVVLDADVASRWGPRLADLLRAVVDATSAVPIG
jgi:iron complex transport system substrate-binding protein